MRNWNSARSARDSELQAGARYARGKLVAAHDATALPEAVLSPGDRHGEQVRRAFRAQAAFDEGKTNGCGPASPVAARDTALIQKGLRGLPGEAQPLHSAAVKNVRVLDGASSSCNSNKFKQR
jgi:hypothetical protein